MTDSMPREEAQAAGVDWAALEAAAVAAMKNAYAPYSKFAVGAAALTADGRIVSGCNVENASYGLTLCAERVAMVKAISAGAREFTTIVVVTDQARTLMPCGACRQFLYEFAPQLAVICQGASGPRSSSTLAELLPRAFAPGDLH